MGMKNSGLRRFSVMGVQTLWQYTLFGWFLAITILRMLAGSLVPRMARVGIMLIFAAVFSVLIALGEQFRAEGRRKWMILCYLLIAILAATAVIKMI